MRKQDVNIDAVLALGRSYGKAKLGDSANRRVKVVALDVDAKVSYGRTQPGTRVEFLDPAAWQLDDDGNYDATRKPNYASNAKQGLGAKVDVPNRRLVGEWEDHEQAKRKNEAAAEYGRAHRRARNKYNERVKALTDAALDDYAEKPRVLSGSAYGSNEVATERMNAEKMLLFMQQVANRGHDEAVRVADLLDQLDEYKAEFNAEVDEARDERVRSEA